MSEEDEAKTQQSDDSDQGNVIEGEVHEKQAGSNSRS